MRNSKLKLIMTAATLAGSVALFSAFAHGEGEGMMGMMNMMSDMSPEDRKAMMASCMKMMQSHAGDVTHSDTDDKGGEAR